MAAYQFQPGERLHARSSKVNSSCQDPVEGQPLRPSSLPGFHDARIPDQTTGARDGVMPAMLKQLPSDVSSPWVVKVVKSSMRWSALTVKEDQNVKLGEVTIQYRAPGRAVQ